ncbi:MAG: hypothetical protein M3R01_10740 [Actinomycetota bacterium]|nr:hypothetical protein [Acidimicrobiia bacterium]MDQ3147387.1 hypothetical protein [Actinomycetota bacterium]
MPRAPSAGGRRRIALLALLAIGLGAAGVGAALDGDGPPEVGRNPFAGVGAWVDVYDWSEAHGRERPLVDAETVDAMADNGAETLYVQTARADTPGDVLEPDRLASLVDRARSRGMAVVAWYLPTLEEPDRDLRRLRAMAEVDGVDAVAVDIEARQVADVTERNRRLVRLSTELRAAVPEATLGAIALAPVLLEEVNPAFWPSFPWRELARSFDVWLPMSYQSERRAVSGYRDAHRYAIENVDRLRARLGRAGAPVHLIGGIADDMDTGDLDGLLQAATEKNAIGVSLYDWRTTPPALLPLRGTG